MELNEQSSGLVVAEGLFVLKYQDREGEYRCRVSFDLTREQDFLIHCLDSVHQLGLGLDTERVLLRASARSKFIECEVETMRDSSLVDGKVDLLLRPIAAEAAVEFGPSALRMNGAVANLYPYWMGSPKNLNFCLEGGDWVFEFTATGEQTLQYPAQIQNDSYALTHHFEARKRHNEGFSLSASQAALRNLSTFLSFCSERWVCPVLVRGTDPRGESAFEEWGTRMLDPRHSPRNWLDPHNGKAMTEVFPGFWDLMEDPAWSKVATTAVYWYVRADTAHTGSDGAIILIQAALERLAWHVLVRTRRAISEDDFSKKLSTAGRIRLLLELSSIPLDFPIELGDLAGFSPRGRWIDGPEAFVTVRNQIVHPRQRSLSTRGYFEALQLGKWYVELVLLRACHFNGSYLKRLKIPSWVGDVEIVPWVRNGTQSASNS